MIPLYIFKNLISVEQPNSKSLGNAVFCPRLFTFQTMPVFYGKKQPAGRTMAAVSHCTNPYYQTSVLT
jgi:hypothetical protein